MRTTLASFVAAVALVGLVATGAAAQDQDRERRGPVPAPGMLAIGGSIGAAPAADPSFTGGLALTGNVESYLSRRVSIRGQVDGAWWDITGRGFTGTVRPMALDGNLVYNFEGGRIHPFVTGGVGIYHYRFNEVPTTGSANKAGLDAGAGVEYFVRRHTTLTGEFLYHDVAEPVTSPVTTYNLTHFWTFTVGVKKYFR
jgi:hypothetical protein